MAPPPRVCPHAPSPPPAPPADRADQFCVDCNCKGPNLWMCLQKDCMHIGCSDNDGDHNTTHYRDNPLHYVHMNITNGNIWCYACKQGVLSYPTFPTVSHLPETIVNNYINQVGNNASGGLKGAGERMRAMSSFGLDRGPSLNVSGAGDSQESSDADDDDALDCNYDGKPRGLVGLQNIGNTCYMNSAIQALSNTPPLTQYFLDCAATVDFLTDNKKPGVSRSYQKLVKEIWNKKTRGYVVPNGILYGIRNVHPMFRGYHQHDTQEFLRCFMDQLHEELKEPVRDNNEAVKAPSETKYITKQPQQQTLFLNHTLPGSCNAIASRTNNECDVKDNDVKRRQRSPARSFDNIPSATSNRYYRVNAQIEDVEVSSNGVANYGHRRSASYCDPCGYSQLPQDIKDESPASSPRPVSPLDYMDQENSEKELDDDDEETYETCDSGASDSSSLSGDENYTAHTSVGFKRKHDNVEKQVSESEVVSDTSSNIMKYRSVISDVFDGKLLSSVQCLTCDRISTRVETFKDLSLPIPSRDHMAVLQNSASTIGSTSGGSTTTNTGGRSTACSDAVYSATSSQEGWVWWILGWLRSWLYGPAVTLHDCLAAFFSADELKGENMYSCEKCSKLRNGVKFSKVLGLPEVLCVHLKRFRHELMSSTKIGAKVSFPLTGLDMRPYMHKDCTSTVSTYELVAIICHTGTAGAGHYTCVARNRHAGSWFEFDDQYVTGLTPEQVSSCEAYVLFYKKVNPRMTTIRQRAMELLENAKESNDTKYFISKQWINRFNTYAEPGPIDNTDFLCCHGGVPPDRTAIVDRLTTVIPENLWEYLYQIFGGGPTCSLLHVCVVCQAEAEMLQERQKTEFKLYTLLHHKFIDSDLPTSIYAINMNWYKLWLAFARNKSQQIPPPIDNTPIVPKTSIQDNHVGKSPTTVLPNCDYVEVNEELWKFFHSLYGGGPEVLLKSVPSNVPQDHTTTGQSYNNFAEQTNPTVNVSFQPSHRQSDASTVNSNKVHRKSSESERSNGTDGPHAKSLSNVDLFNMESKYDNSFGKTSVKGTQSLQDVSVRQQHIKCIPNVNAANQNSTQQLQYNKESENHTMLVETSGGVIEYTLKPVPFVNGNNDAHCSMLNGRDNDIGDQQTAANKKKGKSTKKTMLKQYETNSKPTAHHATNKRNSKKIQNEDVESSYANDVPNHNQEIHNSCEQEKIGDIDKMNPLNVSNMMLVSNADSHMDLTDLESITLKPKIEPSPGVHQQHVVKSGGGKHRKPIGKKEKRNGSNKKGSGVVGAGPKSTESVPMVNGGEKAAK